MQFFGSLQLLMALLGSSWSVLGGFGSRMGFPKFSNMLSKVCQKMIQKTRPWRVPEWVPKRWKIEIAGLRHFLPWVDFFHFFFMFFFRFWSSLGASWEPSWASWGSLGRPLDPKTCKNQVFFNGFEKAVFWSLKLLMALCVHLGCFLGKSGPKMGCQNGCQKWLSRGSKNDFDMFTTSNNNLSWLILLLPFCSSFGTNFGTHFEPQNWFKIC